MQKNEFNRITEKQENDIDQNKQDKTKRQDCERHCPPIFGSVKTKTELAANISVLKREIKILQIQMADDKKMMTTMKDEMRAMKYDKESRTEQIKTLLLDQNRRQEQERRKQEQERRKWDQMFAQLMVAISHNDNTSTTQSQRNPMTDVNPPTTIATVTINIVLFFGQHSKLLPQPKLERKKKKRKCITKNTNFLPRLPPITKHIHDVTMITTITMKILPLDKLTTTTTTTTMTIQIATMNPMATRRTVSAPILDKTMIMITTITMTITTMNPMTIRSTHTRSAFNE